METDTIHYALHPPHLSAPALHDLCYELLAYIHAQCQSPFYIWHRQPFALQVVRDDKAGARLEGKTYVGDCVDDEWFIVYLLRSVSLKWPDLVIRYVTSFRPTIGTSKELNSVWDTDGQFLLIEAANVLPRWVSPTNADQRVRSPRSC